MDVILFYSWISVYWRRSLSLGVGGRTGGSVEIAVWVGADGACWARAVGAVGKTSVFWGGATSNNLNWRNTPFAPINTLAV